MKKILGYFKDYNDHIRQNFIFDEWYAIDGKVSWAFRTMFPLHVCYMYVIGYVFFPLVVADILWNVFYEDNKHLILGDGRCV